MPDSRRTWAALAALYADNTAGAISPQDLRDGFASIKPHVAASAPGASDDETLGFDVGHAWIDTSTSPSSVYECLDASTGAAVWVKVYPPEAPSVDAEDVTYDNAASGLTAEDVQAAIDEVVGGLGTAAAADAADFATAAQGALADTALQPGDELTALAATGVPAGHVPKADGAGNIAWGAESGGGGGAAWGGITGTLSDQTDLQTALDAKLGKSATVQSYAGNRTLDASNNGAYIRITAAGTVTLPDGLATGFQCVIVNATDSDTVALSAATTLTLPTGFDAEVQNRRAVTVIHVGSNEWEAHGALVEEEA